MKVVTLNTAHVNDIVVQSRKLQYMYVSHNHPADSDLRPSGRERQ
jgi:hypothetical protein